MASLCGAQRLRLPRVCGALLRRPMGTLPPVSAPHLWGSETKPLGATVGSANLPWGDLGFDYVPTNGHVRHVYKDGKWDAGRYLQDPFISVHLLGNVFHYGQALFEGLKAFHTKDGDVCLFFEKGCYRRMQHGCERFLIPEVPYELWITALKEAVRMNIAYVPPYGSGGALYLRPFIFGSGPKLGLGPSPEYTFVVMVNPVGSYYAKGKMPALPGLVNDRYDRAAPLGCGDCKAAGNYAADLQSMMQSKKSGFPISLYLDAKDRKYVEEFNTSNFVAITKDNKYLTPSGERTVLKSNTNIVLREIARDHGMAVERRDIDFEEEVDTFAEVGAVGTAVVVTPLKSLTRDEKTWNFDDSAPTLRKLHDSVRAIQNGEVEDKHGWMTKVSLDLNLGNSTMSIYPPL